MAKNEMGEEKLLGFLSWFYRNGKLGRDPDVSWHAYNKLVEIVKQHFQQQPVTVTREEVQELVYITEDIREGEMQFNEVLNWLKSKNIQVED